MITWTAGARPRFTPSPKSAGITMMPRTLPSTISGFAAATAREKVTSK